MAKQMKLSGFFKAPTPTNVMNPPAATSTSHIEQQQESSGDEQDDEPAAPAAAQRKIKKRKFVTAWKVKYPGIFERDEKLYCKACTT